MSERGGYGRTSLACSRVKRGRVGKRGMDSVLSAETAAEGAIIPSSQMVVVCDVSMAEVSKIEDGSGDTDCCRVEENCVICRGTNSQSRHQFNAADF